MITSSEAAVLRSIASNCFNHMNYGMPTCFAEADGAVWTDCINDSKFPSGYEARDLSGICGSLVKKNLIQSLRCGRDSTVCMTEAGYNEMVWFFAKQKVCA